MTKFLERYRLIIFLLLIVVGLWSWYFLVYTNEFTVEDTIWVKESDNQKFIKFKTIVENRFEKDGYNFINYLDTPTFNNYTYAMTSEGFKIIGNREWEEDVLDSGKVKFKQKLVILITFDESDFSYHVQAQTQSKCCVLRTSSKWKDWNVGNDKIAFRCTDKELRNSILDVSSTSNKLDIIISSTIDKLRNMFGTAPF